VTVIELPDFRTGLMEPSLKTDRKTTESIEHPISSHNK